MWSLKNFYSASSPSSKSISSCGGSSNGGSITFPSRQHLEKIGFFLGDLLVLSSIQCNAPHEEHSISISPRNSHEVKLANAAGMFFSVNSQRSIASQSVDAREETCKTGLSTSKEAASDCCSRCIPFNGKTLGFKAFLGVLSEMRLLDHSLPSLEKSPSG
ncbi:hypothetical protein MKW98_015680 [Papaver atlanticum]|uniref:Uncharacterized protein n=1 Tax=Papaver atlanticum TaxID=357466 RepID=A0AAD4XGQ8_9MAGN|nr:hypothetical protein MKW98_015680 [Papaver atlanticum]